MYNKDLVKVFDQRGVLVFILDQSKAVKGVKWDNMVKSVKILLSYFRENHRSAENLKVLIIFYAQIAV